MTKKERENLTNAILFITAIVLIILLVVVLFEFIQMRIEFVSFLAAAFVIIMTMILIIGLLKLPSKHYSILSQNPYKE